jgi:hypothetical protein
LALTTYAQLKSAVADWLERSDLTDRVADFITLTESRLNRLLRLRLMESDQSLTATPGLRTILLPAGFREPVALWLEAPSGRQALSFVDTATLEASATRGQPRQWTIDGANLAFERPCDQAYGLTLRILGRLALSDASPSNSVLADYPDLYLFGALVEAAPYLRDAEMLSLFSARFETVLAEARMKEARSRSLSNLRFDPVILTSGRSATGLLC